MIDTRLDSDIPKDRDRYKRLARYHKEIGMRITECEEEYFILYWSDILSIWRIWSSTRFYHAAVLIQQILEYEDGTATKIVIEPVIAC